MKYRIVDTTDVPLLGALVPDAMTIPFGTQSMIIEPVGAEVMPIVYRPPLDLFSAIETPATGTPTVVGTITVSGYATQFDLVANRENIKQINLFYDGVDLGAVTYGILRMDITNPTANYKNRNIGFTFDLDTKRTVNGTREIKLVIQKYVGDNVSLVRNINVNNPVTVLLPLRYTTDSPRAGFNTITDIYKCEGWVTQRDTGLNRPNITTVEILYNNVSQGFATMGQARPDVDTAFPEQLNPTAGWIFNFNSAQYPDGAGTISVIFSKADGSAQDRQDIPVNLATNSSGTVGGQGDGVGYSPTYSTAPVGNITCKAGVNFRTEPSSAQGSATVIRLISFGEVATLLEVVNGTWWKIRDKNNVLGYCSNNYWNVTKDSRNVLADGFIRWGMQYEGLVGGVPRHDYQFSASDTQTVTFDCSSFTKHVFTTFGVGSGTPAIRRASCAQSQQWDRITSLASLKKGDIMFFTNASSATARDDCGTGDNISHVGICIEDGGLAILHTFRVGIGVTAMQMTDHWRGRFKWGCRTINAGGTGYIQPRTFTYPT